MRLSAAYSLGLLLASSYTSPLFATASCDPIATFADLYLPVREIFVGTNGNNSTGDGSPANPFQTIGRALQLVQPGDAIRLFPGNHTPDTFISDLNGSSNAPIWIGGALGSPRPVILGGQNALHLSRIRYLIIENLEIANASVNGINTDDAGDYSNTNATRFVLFRNLAFRDIGTGGNNDGLKLSGVNDYFVLDCTFDRMSAGGSAIDHVGCHRGVIARCTFTDAGSNAVQCKGGSEDIEIRWNRFVNGGSRAINLGGSTGFEFFRPPLSTNSPNAEARNIRVLANLFRGSETPVAFVGAVDSLFAQNTLVQPTRWILRILQETVSSGGYTFAPCGRNRFVNNLVYFDRSQISTYINSGANTDPASFSFANNLWYALDNPAQSRPTFPSPETNGVYGLDPRFTDAPGLDFSVPRTSPAAGAGLPPPTARADLLERCYAARPTIGAHEANPPPAPAADADSDGMPDDWEDANALDRLDPADAAGDPDADRLSNLGEYLAGTNPRDPLSTFELLAPRLTNALFAFDFPSATGRVYHVYSRGPLPSSPWTDTTLTTAPPSLTFTEPTSDTALTFRVEVRLAPQ